MKILIFALIVIYVLSPLVRVIIKNLHLIGIYSVADLMAYIKYRRWDDFNLFGIDMFIGMFGHGKTLSMTHRARLIYNKYGDKVRFISNYKLVDIPYIPLINFNQLVDIGEEESSDYIGTVVLIDEVENVLSHRNFANFPLPLLHTLTQQRKKRVYILCSAQRFFMVDKIFRSITTNVINCNKFWRFQHCELYDAWDLENAMNYRNIRRKQNLWWFVKNQDFNSYDTSEMVKKSTAEDFISNDETLVRKGLDSMANSDAILHRSKRLIRQEKTYFKKQSRKG
ncbi:MAG: hypothetical protein K6F34_11445 [Lachnospiraceae bacterium]|nr:hypothetical protein [Lachnospiraceae bacterium]